MDSKGPKFNLLLVIKIFRWYSKVTWRIISLKLGLWLLSIGLLPSVPYGAYSTPFLLIAPYYMGDDMGTTSFYGLCQNSNEYLRIKDFFKVFYSFIFANVLTDKTLD